MQAVGDREGLDGVSSSDSMSGSDSSCFAFFLGGRPFPFAAVAFPFVAAALPLPLAARLGLANGASSSSSSSDSTMVLVFREARLPLAVVALVVVAWTAPGIGTAAVFSLAGDEASGLSSSLDDSEAIGFFRLSVRVSGVTGSDFVRVVCDCPRDGQRRSPQPLRPLTNGTSSSSLMDESSLSRPFPL